MVLILAMMMSADYVLVEVENGCAINSTTARITKTQQIYNFFVIQVIYSYFIYNLLNLVY